MAFVPIANCARLEMFFLTQGQNWEMVLHYLGDFDPPEQMLQDMCENIVDVFVPDIHGVLCNDTTLIGVKATDMSAVDAPTFYLNVDPPVAGAWSGQALPLNVAGIVSWKTANRGRNARGRTFIGGMAEAATDGSTVVAGWITAATAFANQLLSLSTYTGPVNLCVASRYFNGQPRTQGVTYPVTGFAIRNIVGTQRRRLPGRGT